MWVGQAGGKRSASVTVKSTNSELARMSTTDSSPDMDPDCEVVTRGLLDLDDTGNETFRDSSVPEESHGFSRPATEIDQSFLRSGLHLFQPQREDVQQKRGEQNDPLQR